MKKNLLIAVGVIFFCMPLYAQKKYVLDVKSLKCIVTNAPFSDEIYFRVDGVKGAILDFNAGKTITWQDGRYFFDSSVIVQLWEEDYTSDDDFLGEVTIYGYESQKGLRTYNYKGGGADYILTYEVFKNE